MILAARFICRKAQASLFTIWILVILAVLTISIANRASLGLRLSRYQQERFKALCLAKSGINRAIFEVINDKTLNYDGLADNWAFNEEVFKRITLNENKDEFALVRQNGVFGVVDEERKININTAEANLLTAIFSGFQGYGDELIKDIRIWRGDSGLGLEEQDSDEYKSFKKAPFVNLEELLVVLEYFYRNSGREDYRQIAQEVFESTKNFLTVYTLDLGLKVNINTIPKETLLIIAGARASGQEEINIAPSLIEKIIALREAAGYFKTADDIVIPGLGVGSGEENLFNKLKENFIFKSDVFLIESCGFVGTIKSKVFVVYNRKDKKILYWHEGY